MFSALALKDGAFDALRAFILQFQIQLSLTGNSAHNNEENYKVKKIAARTKSASKKKPAPKPLTFAQAAARYKGPLKLDRKLSTLVRGVWHLRGVVVKIDAKTGKKVTA